MMPEAHFATVYAKPAGRPLSIPSLPKCHRIPGFSSLGTWSLSHRHQSFGFDGSGKSVQQMQPGNIVVPFIETALPLNCQPTASLCRFKRLNRARCNFKLYHSSRLRQQHLHCALDPVGCLSAKISDGPLYITSILAAISDSSATSFIRAQACQQLKLCQLLNAWINLLCAL